MSFYVLLAGGIIEIVALVTGATAVIITAVLGNQSEDKNEKASLRAAAGFLGVAIGFIILTYISLFAAMATKGCKKKSKILLIIFFVMFLISYIIGLVIIFVFMRRRQAAGDEAGATALRAAFTLPLVALGLHVLSFILIYVVLGRKLKRVRKFCRKIPK